MKDDKKRYAVTRKTFNFLVHVNRFAISAWMEDEYPCLETTDLQKRWQKLQMRLCLMTKSLMV